MPTNRRKVTVVLLAIAFAFSCGVLSAAAVEEGEIAYLRYTGGHWQVWLTDVKGKQHRQLTQSEIDKTRISWTPDNQSLLINLNDGRLAQVSIKDGHEVPLELPIKGMLDAGLSPDGKTIVFSLAPPNSPDTNDLWVVDVVGKEAKKLTNQPGGAQTPSWHPSGKMIVYTTGSRTKSFELWRVKTSGEGLNQLTVGGGFKFDPVYGPNNELIYSANTSGNYDLWISDSENSTPKRLTSDPAYEAQPTVSPDGDHVAFYSLKDGKKRIWMLDRKHDTALAITPADAQSRYPVWAH